MLGPYAVCVFGTYIDRAVGLSSVYVIGACNQVRVLGLYSVYIPGVCTESCVASIVSVSIRCMYQVCIRSDFGV